MVGIEDKSIAGYSGINENVDVGAPLNASARFSGEFALAKVSSVNRSSSSISGLVSGDTGVIDLNANFATGKLWGNNIFKDFKVNGDISGKDLGGSIKYQDVKADLDGQIGQDGVVAAFHGTSETKVVVGGLVAVPK